MRKEWFMSAANDELTEKIIACAYQVSNTLGCGFLEKVYENALVHELRKGGIKVAQQAPVRVIYDGIDVGEYVADLIVDNQVILELKAVSELNDIHSAQTLNYLKATDLKVALLLSFGKSKVDIRRFVNKF